MRIYFAAAIAFACVYATPAEAKGTDLSREFTGDRYSGGSVAPQRTVQRKARTAHRKATKSRTIKGYAKHVARTGTKDLSGYPSALIVKVRELQSSCNAELISAYRPGSRVRGSGRLSLHALRQAVDMKGNPACMRAHMHGWPGGMSTDYGSVGHYHISYSPGGREWGSRFAHYAKRKRHVRYAHAR